MRPILVMQLARLGDLLQTRRLILSLAARGDAGEPAQVHLLTDYSLLPLARLAYPDAVCHGLPAHAGGRDPASAAAACRETLSELSGLDFIAVHNVNYAGLSLALTAFFDPDIVTGHKLVNGQAIADPLAAMALRWTKNRTQAGVNLMDYFAGFAKIRVAPETVHPAAAPGDGGLGVAVSGRQARRSIPPGDLARMISVMAASAGHERITLYGTAAESAAARGIIKNLPAKAAAITRDLTGKTSLKDLWEDVGQLGALLTPDTGLMHLAACLGRPVTALFLSSAWCHETGPYGLGHTVWQATTPCAPCLESAPCGFDLACLGPFVSEQFPRLLGGSPKATVPARLTGYHTGFDALGVVCRPFAGEDVNAAARTKFRALLARRLGIAQQAGEHLCPELAAELYAETDYLI